VSSACLLNDTLLIPWSDFYPRTYPYNCLSSADNARRSVASRVITKIFSSGPLRSRSSSPLKAPSKGSSGMLGPDNPTGAESSSPLFQPALILGNGGQMDHQDSGKSFHPGFFRGADSATMDGDNDGHSTPYSGLSRQHSWVLTHLDCFLWPTDYYIPCCHGMSLCN